MTKLKMLSKLNVHKLITRFKKFFCLDTFELTPRGVDCGGILHSFHQVRLSDSDKVAAGDYILVSTRNNYWLVELSHLEYPSINSHDDGILGLNRFNTYLTYWCAACWGQADMDEFRRKGVIVDGKSKPAKPLLKNKNTGHIR